MRFFTISEACPFNSIQVVKFSKFVKFSKIVKFTKIRQIHKKSPNSSVSKRYLEFTKIVVILIAIFDDFRGLPLYPFAWNVWVRKSWILLVKKRLWSRVMAVAILCTPLVESTVRTWSSTSRKKAGLVMTAKLASSAVKAKQM